MLPIGDAPILFYNLAMLARAGVVDVTLNLHYLPDVIRAYVGNGARWGIQVRYSAESELLGTGGALVPISSRLRDDRFAVVFGDNLIDVDLAEILSAHCAHGGVATVVLWRREDTSQSGVAELDRHDRITRFVEKPQPGEIASHWVNAGLIIAEPELLDAIPLAQPSDLGRDILPALIAAGQDVYGYRMSGGLWWFDRVAEYEAAGRDPELARFTAAFATFQARPQPRGTRS